MRYNLPRNYLSSSQINKYLSCPKQYEREYVLGERPEVKRPIAMSIGSAVHKMAEITLQAELDNISLPELELYLQANPQGMLEGSNLEDQSLEYWVNYSQILYKTWYKNVGNSIMPLSTEKRFDSYVGDVPVMGFIDYVDISSGKPEICDLKVVKRSKSEADCRNSVQLAMYAITQENPCVRFDSLVKTKTPKVGVARHTFTKGELAYYTDLIGEVATNISKGNFPMTSPTQWMCTPKWCDHYNTCRGKHG
jgi:RecB family exonuclease